MKYMPLILLAGCAQMPGQVVEVAVPVQTFVPCPVQFPEKPQACIAPDESNSEWLRCLIIDHEMIKAYSLALETQLSICAE